MKPISAHLDKEKTEVDLYATCVMQNLSYSKKAIFIFHSQCTTYIDQFPEDPYS